MAIEKSIVAPVEEHVSKAEDVLGQLEETAVVPTESEQADGTIAAEDAVPAEAAAPAEAAVHAESVAEPAADTAEEGLLFETAIADKSKVELLDMLAAMLAESPAHTLRREVEAIKIAFYKRHRADVEAQRKAFAAEHGEDAEFTPVGDAMELRLKDLLGEYRTKRDEYIAEMDKVKEENYRAKLAIIEELKTLTGGEETLNNTFAHFRELQARWKAVGQVPQQYLKDLWETYNLHVENFYDFVKINKELRDLDWKKNLEQKTALCEQAEALAGESSVVEAFHKLQKLHDEWRETGPVANEYKEPLWERFKAASSVINRKHQEHFEGIKNEQVANLERKSALCEKVEALVEEELTSHKAWSRAGERLLEIQKEWKTIGFAPKKDNARIYERFRAACDRFFERKRAFYSEVRDDMEANLRLKEEICEAAEALLQSEAWKEATEQILALQEKWKGIGAVSRRQSDAVWKRFRAACDKFFERKSAHFSSIENEYTENLRRKTELLAEMNAADIKEAGYDAIKEFQRRWSEIGFVPIKHKDELQKQYKAAVDKLFGTLRGADREQSMTRFKEKVSGMRSAGDKRLRTERERLYNRVRQLEQEIATLENNIGFFARSKGAEALIADVEAKIAKTKRDMADAIAKVKMIDSEQ